QNGQLVASAARAYFPLEDAISGLLSWANTSITPRTASAAARSIFLMRPLALPLLTRKTCATFGTLNSAAYFALPVTLRGPSIRDTGLPMLFLVKELMTPPTGSL